ncbi:MAG TPA: chemotaxis response regulator protein-glutamate methylesterase, partial [Clostridiaceae bacterium]|nr:chemotaxis response regulator protein-glutamate methylesterase [Clostridiaceae bacterium]
GRSIIVKKNIDQKIPRNFHKNNIKAICVAASTGGPKAIAKIMGDIPEGFKLPVLIVQHMPGRFTREFAERLNDICCLNVKEAEDGDEIKDGHAYVAPGGFHMEVLNNRLYLNKEPPLHGVRPCADKLFISAAENYKDGLIGIVLTGMGTDGTAGLEAINKEGGICMAEDKSTCTIYGMPRSAIEKGVVHIVAPVDKIIGEVIKIIE